MFRCRSPAPAGARNGSRPNDPIWLASTVVSAVTRRGWLLFAAMSVIWGVPYLLIKVAVEDLSPPVVVFGRTSIAAVALLAAAWRTGALAPALRRWRPVLAFAAIEMAGPWWCLTHAEQRLPSGLTGLLVACVPIAGAFTAFALGDRDALKPVRLLGIGVGMGGVALLVAHDLGAHGGVPWWSVVEVLAVCVGYATAPFIAARRLADVPTIGVIAVSLTAVALVYAPLAWFRRPDEAPPADAVWAVVGLAVLCTGIAFLVFFALIAEIGPARAPLITFVNPAVAIVARRADPRRADHGRHRRRLRAGARRVLAGHPPDGHRADGHRAGGRPGARRGRRAGRPACRGDRRRPGRRGVLTWPCRARPLTSPPTCAGWAWRPATSSWSTPRCGPWGRSSTGPTAWSPRSTPPSVRRARCS